MKLYLCDIKSYQLNLGIECTAFADPRLERTQQGIKRDHQEPQRQEPIPLTRPVLLVMLNRLMQLDYNDVVLPAAFSLAFASFLRVGEFTYCRIDLDLGTAFRNWFLTKNSIRIAPGGDYMELTLPASKTDPFRHGIQLTISATNDIGCPVSAMRKLIQIDTHRHSHAPLFCIGLLEQQPCTREYVVQKLQQIAITCGLGRAAWNGHNFRRGAATWAAEVGIPVAQIQILGRWRSDAYKSYIEYSKEEWINLSQRFHNQPRGIHIGKH